MALRKEVQFALALLMVLTAAGAILQAGQEAPRDRELLRLAGSPFQATGVQVPGGPDPDGALFERSMNDLKENRFTVARLTLQMLINTYPDSEYIEKARFALAESFYREGTPSSYIQAEAALKDYLTFFPSSWEADAAQYLIAMIHIKHIEQPDPDLNEAKLAEIELQAFIEHYSESPRMPEARERLTEVESLLAVAEPSAVSAQKESRVLFEVVSIKPNKSGASRTSFACTGVDDKQRPLVAVPLGRCRIENMSVERLIRLGYRDDFPQGSREVELKGLPGWCSSERFDLEAKAADVNSTHAQLIAMLQVVLSERFGLRFHRITNQMSGYRLVVSKEGHKLSPSKTDERFAFLGGINRVRARNAPLSLLIGALARQLDAPVVDSTGLSGHYNFEMTFTRTSLPAAALDNSEGPSIFTALQEQLGLKLEKVLLPFVTFIIDRVQRPSAN